MSGGHKLVILVSCDDNDNSQADLAHVIYLKFCDFTINTRIRWR